MTTVRDILEFTETFAPLDSAADFDNCGVLIGSKDKNITKVLLALDITKDVVKEAKDMGAELIISHHPVIFHPIKSLCENSVPYLLAQAGITALCLHTNLDIADTYGVNVCLANALELTDCKLYKEDFLLLGKLSQTMNVKEFASFTKDVLNADAVLYTESDRPLRTVAMCSGAGADFFKLAKDMGADVLLTGEARHHEYIEAAEGNVPLVTAGHFATEDVVINPLKAKLSELFADVEFYKSETCKNPYKAI